IFFADRGFDRMAIHPFEATLPDIRNKGFVDREPHNRWRRVPACPYGGVGGCYRDPAAGYDVRSNSIAPGRTPFHLECRTIVDRHHDLVRADVLTVIGARRAMGESDAPGRPKPLELGLARCSWGGLLPGVAVCFTLAQGPRSHCS